MALNKKRGFVYILLFVIHGWIEIDHVIGEVRDIALSDISIIVLSQPNIYHARRADIFKKHLDEQTRGGTPADVHLLHERWQLPGAWTVLPLIPDIVKYFSDKAAIVLCEEETRIDLEKLLSSLSKYDFKKELFIGKGLRDKEATIIHHFAFHESPSSFVYPDFFAGLVLSLPLIKTLASRMDNDSLKTDFSIDAKHELAMYIHNKGQGARMKEATFLCTTPSSDHCATTYPTIFPSCGSPVSEDDVFIAVKTCSMFHKDRVPVVKDTWASDAKHIEYYSDTVDASIPTVHLGVPNTERGHCGKTLAIIRKFWQENKSIPNKHNWLIITDDDTLLSVPMLRRLLSCYNQEEPVVLGERYGYFVSDDSGYNYITGGGGMVFSYSAVKFMMDFGNCQCGSDNNPDDMMLGVCFKRLGIIPVHSPYFHQARPMDYCKSFLDHQLPVSFHKHWMIDPRQVYKQWLVPAQHQHQETQSHQEL